jgi:hypothetical protein
VGFRIGIRFIVIVTVGIGVGIGIGIWFSTGIKVGVLKSE